MVWERFCCICCEYRPESLFYYAPENVDGLSYQCKECLKERMREQNKKKGYFKKYYYKKRGIQYPLPTPKAQIVSESPAPIQKSSPADASKTPVQRTESTPVYCVTFT